MRTIIRAFSTLLLASFAATASAQTATTLSDLIDEQLAGSIGPTGTGLLTQRAFMLSLGETRPQIQAATNEAESNLRAAINRQRTDLQLGAPSNSPNATSILEKPGVSDLLSLAIDRGAITKSPSGTGLTLSTTPYALWTGFGMMDTPQRWKDWVVARNLSFSATFSSTDVTNGDFSSFTSGEVKYIVFGNRSPRDPELLRSVRKNLGQTFLVADTDLTRDCGWLLTEGSSFTDTREEMRKWFVGRPNATVAEAHAQLLDLVRPLQVDPQRMKPCIATIIAGEQSIQNGLNAVTEATKAYLAEHPQQLSVATLLVRDETLSDYYAAKLLYGYDRNAVTINLNAEADWNKNSTTAAGVPLRSLRAYSVELGVTSKTFANGRLDGSLSSKASRDKALDSTSSVIGEAKLNLHLNDTLRLPLSLTYANRETQTLKKGWQFNVGISALLDEVMRRLGPSGS